jgi:ATP-dependent helicase/nuclease subunit B
MEPDNMEQNAKGLDERTDFKGQELLRYRNTAFKNVLEFEKQISDCKTAGDYCNALHNFLINEDIESKIENFSKDLLGKGEDEGATALVKAWNELLHLLDQTREIGGETTLTFKDFRGILMSGMESAFAGTIPSSVDQVNFSQIKQITNKSPKILFVIGLSQEAYPPKTPPEGILKDRDRQVFSQYFNVEIPSVLSDKVYEDQFLTFTFLTLPKERIYLTCPKAREQESSVIAFVRESFTGICEVAYKKDPSEVSPLDLQIYSKTSAVNSLTSRLPGENTVENGNDITKNPNSELLIGNPNIQKEWNELDRVFGQNEELKSKIQRLRSIAKKSKRKIGLERADMLECYREPVKMSVSQLETYSSCSYSHLMTYLLRLQPRVTWDVQETDAGSLLHGIAENCIKDFITDFNSVQSPQDKEKVIEKYRNMDFTCFAEAKMRDFCSDERYDTFLENGNKAARGRRAVNIAASTLKAIFGKIEYEDFIPERLEWKFSKDNGNAIKIQIPGLPDVFFNGIVDRVDSCGDYFRVIDYKSADKSVDFDMWYQGLSMQLLAYIAAYHQENPDKLPQDAAYLQFSRPIIKYEDMTPSKIREDHADKLLKAYRLKGPGLDSANLLLASRFAVQKMEQLTGNLLNGKYDIRPRKIAGKQLPCIYCDYSAICGFEQTFDEPLILDALPGKTGEDGKALKKANVFIETIAKECD